MANFDQFDLGRGFRSYFEIVPALDKVCTDEVFRIRHEVYCQDLGYEQIRPDGLETDAFDHRSHHYLLRSVRNPKMAVGCARLVTSDAINPDACFPFEESCRDSLHRHIIDPSKLSRAHIGEVSRLAVRAPFRRRKGEQSNPSPSITPDFDLPQQPRFPYVPIALYLGAIELARRNNIEVLFILTEPRLAEHFCRAGVQLKQIGDPIEHRGQRIPSMLDVRHTIQHMRKMVLPIWHVIQHEIEAGFAEQKQRDQSEV